MNGFKLDYEKFKKINMVIILICTIVGAIVSIISLANPSDDNQTNIAGDNNTLIQGDYTLTDNSERINLEQTVIVDINTTDVESNKEISEDEVIEFLEEDNSMMVDVPEELDLSWESGYVFILKNYYNEFKDFGECKFSLYDINNDNIPELFLNFWYRSNLVYSFKDDKVYRVGEIYNPLYIPYFEDYLVVYGGLGTGIAAGSYITFNGEELAYDKYLGYSQIDSEGNIEFELKGKSVSVEEYEEYTERLYLYPLDVHVIDESIHEGTITFYITD